MTPTQARLAVLGAAMLFSTGGAAIKAATLTSWQVAGLRSWVAAVFLLTLAPATRRAWSRGVLAVSVAYAATLVLFVTANKLTTAAHAIFLQATSPAWIVLIGPRLLGEPVRRNDLVALAAIGLGMVLFISSGDRASAIATDPALGNAIATASGLTWALTVMGMRWLAREPSGGGDPAAAAAALGSIVSGAVCLPWMFPITDVSTTDVAVIGWLGIFQIGCAYLLITRAMPSVPALEAALLLMVEPLLSGVWAWLLHGEVPGPLAVGGAVMILVGLILRSLPGR